MRVAVIAPPYPLEECPAPPLGVTYVASAFEATGAEVKIFDYIVTKYTHEKLVRELQIFRPQIVGVTSVTMNFPIALDIVRTVKSFDESILTVMGGPHVSFDVFSSLQAHSAIDVIVMGEAEHTIPELVECVRGKMSFEQVKGIAFRRDDLIIYNGWRKFIEDLDSLPIPARHLLPLSRYQALGYPVSVITGRGCPYGCIFCLGGRIMGRKVRLRSPRKIVDEIEEILSYGMTRINIADDLFTSSKQKVKALCREIKERRVTFSWSAFARVDTVDAEMLTWMREAGCDSVSFGIESGNAEMLKRIGKGITLEDVRRAVRFTKEVGIIAHASFMVGLPGESLETLRETSNFAQSLGIMYGYHFFAPFPGTRVRDFPSHFDLEILTHDWRLYDANRPIVRTSHLSPGEMESFVADFDRKIQVLWEEKVKGYHEGTNSLEDDLRVEGQMKLNLVFAILTEDLIEECGVFSVTNSGISPEDTLGVLAMRIAAKTESNVDFVTRTLKHFVDSGYIKHRVNGGDVEWYWTKNNQEV